MNKIEVKARAKINLTLDILGKRPDGYHEVEMIMQTIDLHDVLTLQEIPSGVEVTTNHPLLTAGKSNIAFKAARLIIDSLKISRGVRVHICKNIPVAAGLAGGSTDAAAVLKGLNKLWDLGMSKEQMAKKGAVIGSDVPFCIGGGTAIARGRGEKLQELPPTPDIWLVLAKPALEVSTAEVYKNYDSGKVVKRPDTQGMVTALQTGDLNKMADHLVNVLETVTFHKHPMVAEIKEVIKEYGAIGALMSGSGPTVFGLADSDTTAENIAKKLSYKFPEIFIKVTRLWSPRQQELTEKI